MPTIIIRPVPEWNETTVSDHNITAFWRKIDEYWANTMDEMAELENTTNTPFNAKALYWVHDCLSQFDAFSNATSASTVSQLADAEEASERGCPVIFDSWRCWPAAARGQTVTQSCPDFPHLGFEHTRTAYKFCTESGTWWRHPETNMTWSNYTQCVDIQDLNFRQSVNVISLSGLGISLFALLLSLFIFFSFKNLNCGRIKMHKNLFMALAMNNFCWILWYNCVLYQPSVWKSNPVWCRVLHVVKNYFMLSTYSWMLGEGTYLQLLLVNTWRVKRWQIWSIVVACWTLPIFSIGAYAWARAVSERENRACWMDMGSSIWFLGVPVIVIMVVNLAFVFNVIRVIRRKRGSSLQTEDSAVANSSQISTLRAARAALVLVPILGLHFILLPMRPDQGSTLEYIYEVVSAISSSFQGFLVSLLFCFLNSEVLEVVKKKLLRCYRARFGDANLDNGESGHRKSEARVQILLDTKVLLSPSSCHGTAGTRRAAAGTGTAAAGCVQQQQKQRRTSPMTETAFLSTNAAY